MGNHETAMVPIRTSLQDVLEGHLRLCPVAAGEVRRAVRDKLRIVDVLHHEIPVLPWHIGPHRAPKDCQSRKVLWVLEKIILQKVNLPPFVLLRVRNHIEARHESAHVRDSLCDRTVVALVVAGH